MISTHVAAALLSAAIAAVSAWAVQSWRMDAQVQSGKTALESLKREHAESLTRATASALNATIAWQKVKDDAIDQALHAPKARERARALGACFFPLLLRLQLDCIKMLC